MTRGLSRLLLPLKACHEDVVNKLEELTAASGGSISDFANAYKYYGLHRLPEGGWVFRNTPPMPLRFGL